jgi:hypothetical protein
MEYELEVCTFSELAAQGDSKDTDNGQDGRVEEEVHEGRILPWKTGPSGIVLSFAMGMPKPKPLHPKCKQLHSGMLCEWNV